VASNAARCRGRNADVWEALIAVADLAGDHWPETARVTAVTLVTASQAGRPSVGVQLLSDIRTVFDRCRADRLFTESLLTELRGIEEAPWAVIRRGEPLDARGLAQRLRKYDIKPDVQRIDEEVSRGYTRAQFADAWSRYLPMESVTSVTSVTNAGEDGDTVTAVTAVTPSRKAVVADLLADLDGHGDD
jgi:hypothetical protein